MDVIDELSWEIIYLCTWTSQINVRKAIHDEGYYQLMIAHENTGTKPTHSETVCGGR